jgi:phage terminase large subunit-like protein
MGAYETAIHLTGLYPKWWEGRVWDSQLLVWACGVKTLKVRDVNQKLLLGPLEQHKNKTGARGGLIPARKIGRIIRKGGVVDAVDRVEITHESGHTNILAFKSYEEGTLAFESESVNFIWLDEEPPKPVYDSCQMRIFDNGGSIFATLTPVEGMTETVVTLLKGTGII